MSGFDDFDQTQAICLDEDEADLTDEIDDDEIKKKIVFSSNQFAECLRFIWCFFSIGQSIMFQCFVLNQCAIYTGISASLYQKLVKFNTLQCIVLQLTHVLSDLSFKEKDCDGNRFF